MGVRHENVIVCDRQGVIWRGRPEGMDQWKSARHRHPKRSLEESAGGRDIFLACRPRAPLKPEYVKMAASRSSSQWPDGNHPARGPGPRGPFTSSPPGGRTINQVNNVLGFPSFIFAARSTFIPPRSTGNRRSPPPPRFAELAREPGAEPPPMAEPQLRPADYIIPPFDPRLLEVVSSAVAKAAMDERGKGSPSRISTPISLKARLNPTTSVLTTVYRAGRANPKRVIFAEAERGGAARRDPVPRFRLWRNGAGGPPMR